MVLIKPKSLLVVILSSIVISVVLVCTLIGYYMYIELRATDDEKSYHEALKKVEAKIFSKYIDIAELSCDVETAGLLKKNPAIKGVVKNRSARRLYNIVLRVKFLDMEGVSIYEVVFQPLEPTFGIDRLGPMTVSYLTGSREVNFLAAHSSKAFKRIVISFPKEFLEYLGANERGKKRAGAKSRRWSGRLTAEVISVNL